MWAKVYRKGRNLKEIAECVLERWGSLQSDVPLLRYMQIPPWNTRLPNDFRVSVKDTVYLEYPRRISHIHGVFRNYSKARTTPYDTCRKEYRETESLIAVDYARSLYKIAGELHRFIWKF